ncbi:MULTISPECIES: precorrin-4 C(11)-methyltransferase [Clostridium]|uniref:precorrin-4 C(11)-methyltransferase n=1 Tax=Clostridium TaxID=1485 RepID=UPI00069E8DB8|nr:MULTISPECIES: precorrin-4 C(11)-methyltransferase [Clostridium]KOF57091.1 cobalt-precorrin-4 C(11)-methyltransferase [Clostridium sp. DMHC 10]MCD2348503.1 precorrin-4 C(11)-methyltransferase [Clostridium guangxiense]
MVSFIGAGPGDVDLITVKGREKLETADVVIYAGSLVAKEHMNFCKAEAEIFNSAKMTLEEVIEVMRKADALGKKVVRLHTGDPSIYGAIKEQMDKLAYLGIQFEVVPGVSSFTASAAAIKGEFTLPGVSQTVIITRLEGRTQVPTSESLELLAAHKTSMAIFLSAQSIESVVEKLKIGYEREDVPVAVVYKATWKEEKIIIGILYDIVDKVKKAQIKNFAQILVGDFINANYYRSKLYDPTFTHGFREASK